MYRAAPRITNLGDGFYDSVAPARFPKHVLRFRNQRSAERVGLGSLDDAAWESHFAKFESLPDNLTTPLALRYHGHQFDVYNPGLGDGRGFLFAQIEDDASRLLDFGTKGSGTTPWSRGGDGRLTLKGGVREVLATEMLEALGVSTSKSFSLFETGESLMRGDEPSPSRSSVLVRLSHSHVRFGTFQRLAYTRDVVRLEKLVDYSIENYFPDAEKSDRISRFARAVTERTIDLMASWWVAGFVHGVLNSDNMVITGESFDYGPYRFLPTYDVEFVAAYFDHEGLYAFGRQPTAVLRNVMRFIDALRVIDPALAMGALVGDFEERLLAHITKRVVARLGLVPNAEMDEALCHAVFAFLARSQIGYDRFFFDWYGGASRESRALSSSAKSFYIGEEWHALRELLVLYEPADALPAYFDGDAPCTLLIEEIESIWSAIAERDDWAPFEAKISRIRAIP